MLRTRLFALLAGACLAHPALAEPLSLDAARYGGLADEDIEAARPIRVASQRGNLGGGFIEFLFGGGDERRQYAPRANMAKRSLLTDRFKF